ncbi:MAG: HPr family phosphocarrier protein [bacterium]
MIEEMLEIKNTMGLHARPSAVFVEIASQYESDIVVGKEGLEVNGKSIMGLLMLAAEKGSKVLLRVSGDDEKYAFNELKKFLDGKCDED